MLDRFHELDRIEHEPSGVTVYIDEEQKLLGLPIGSMLYLVFEDNAYYIFLKIVSDDGTTTEWKDFLYRNESDLFQDDGLLPEPDQSNVARKLHELSIAGPFEFAGALRHEKANLTRSSSHATDPVAAYLEKIEFPGAKCEYRLVIEYTDEDHLADAEALLDEILSKHSIDRVLPRPKMETFLKAIER